MQVWNRGDINAASRRAIEDMDLAQNYPKEVETKNDGVAHLMYAIPGIFKVTSENADMPPLVITGGMHGDEKAGIVILDRLIQAIIDGTLPVKRSLLLMYGNLQAMKANNFSGVRCTEPEAGVTSNLNRCFGRGKFDTPRCYAEKRANEMTTAIERFVEAHGRPEVLDVHQSFSVPTLRDVRGGVADRSEYTYAMLYPVNGDLETKLRWIHAGFSDIVAGAVVNDMSLSHHTFAGYMAAAFGAHAVTLEQGTIGFVDHTTFTPQLQENLARKIAGEEKLTNPEGFDVWRYLRGITKKSKNFRFVDDDGVVMGNRAPIDFLPRPAGIFARDGYDSYELATGERPLFAKADVPIGDRAAAVIERLETGLVPAP